MAKNNPPSFEAPPILLAQPFTPRSSSFPEDDFDYSPPSTPIMTPRTEYDDDDELPPTYEEAQRAVDPNHFPSPNVLQVHRLAISDEPAPPPSTIHDTEKLALHHHHNNTSAATASNPSPEANPAWETSSRPRARDGDGGGWDDAGRHTTPGRWWQAWGAGVEQRSLDFGRRVEVLGELFGRRAGAWGEEVGRRADSWGQEVGRRAHTWGNELGRSFANGDAGPRPAEAVAAEQSRRDAVTGRGGGATAPALPRGFGGLQQQRAGRCGYGNGAAAWGQRFGPGYAWGQEHERGLLDGAQQAWGRDFPHRGGRHWDRSGRGRRDGRDGVETTPVADDSDEYSSGSEDERADPQHVFVEKLREINARAESLRAQGRTPESQIRAERDRAIEKAHREKEKALLDYELERAKRDRKRQLKTSKREMRTEYRGRKKEMHHEKRQAKKEWKRGSKGKQRQVDIPVQ